MIDKSDGNSFLNKSHGVITISVYPEGIICSSHKNTNGEFSKLHIRESSFHLRLRETRDFEPPQGKYEVFKDNPLENLEAFIHKINKKGILGGCVVYLGLATDCFIGFDKKFDLVTSILEIFNRYQAGCLIVQTRQPIILSVIHLIKSIADRALVIIPIETKSERILAQLLPGYPKIQDRIATANSLRQQGIKVGLSASPILPYGSHASDLWDYANLLVNNSDYINFSSITLNVSSRSSEFRQNPLVKRLIHMNSGEFLRMGSFIDLQTAVTKLSPEKLVFPINIEPVGKQIEMFAA